MTTEMTVPVAWRKIDKEQSPLLGTAASKFVWLTELQWVTRSDHWFHKFFIFLAGSLHKVIHLSYVWNVFTHLYIAETTKLPVILTLAFFTVQCIVCL